MPIAQTKNDRDLKFGTHTPLEHNLKPVFSLFEKGTLKVTSLENLPHNVDLCISPCFSFFLSVRVDMFSFMFIFQSKN